MMDNQQEISRAVYVACQNGNANMLRSLVNACAYLNFHKGSQLASPLHVVAQEGHIECAQILLENGANVNIYMGNGLTPLMVTCLRNRKSVAELLIKHKANVNQQREGGVSTALSIAADEGYFDIVELLVTNGAEVNSKSTGRKPPLLAACLSGRLDIVEYLLLQGANVNAYDSKGVMALHCACQNGHSSIIQTLISNGAELNAWSSAGTPLSIAIKSQNIDIVRFLLDKRADPNMKGTENESTSLHTAAQVGNHVILQLLLGHGAAINAKDEFGETALHDAVSTRSGEVLQWLLLKGADPNASSHDHTTPLMKAALKGDCRAGEILLTASAQVDARDDKQYTALHCAAQNGHAKFVELLLQNGANPKALTCQNVTALDIATRRGRSDVVEVLLKNHPGVPVGKIHERIAIEKHYIKPHSKNKSEGEMMSFAKIMNTEVGKSSKFRVTKIINSIHLKPQIKPDESPELRTELEKAILDHADRFDTELDMTEIEHDLKERKAVDDKCSFTSARSMLNTLAAGSRSDWAEVLMSLLKTKPQYADITDSISKELHK